MYIYTSAIRCDSRWFICEWRVRKTHIESNVLRIFIRSFYVR